MPSALEELAGADEGLGLGGRRGPEVALGVDDGLSGVALGHAVIVVRGVGSCNLN
jgi:hypothetical protein